MMAVAYVDDLHDARLRSFTGLTDMQMRMVTEPAEGIFLAEGEKVIRRALAAGLTMLSALMEPKWWPGLEPHVPAPADVFLAPPDVLKQITGFRLHRGALATFRRPPGRDASEVLRGARSAVLLEDLVDHTNVGAVFRSAAGLGVDALLVTARCADPWYRRSVKTSMGAVFTMRWATVDDATAGVAAAKLAGMHTVALDPSAATSIRDWRPDSASMLLLGTEGPGLTQAARELTDTQLRIPMAHGVDSLNVAMAATVACYVLTS
jgi:tRNA G18 (ribose-2'-O)-methylase SpoU